MTLRWRTAVNFRCNFSLKMTGGGHFEGFHGTLHFTFYLILASFWYQMYLGRGLRCQNKIKFRRRKQKINILTKTTWISPKQSNIFICKGPRKFLMASLCSHHGLGRPRWNGHQTFFGLGLDTGSPCTLHMHTRCMPYNWSLQKSNASWIKVTIPTCSHHGYDQLM